MMTTTIQLTEELEAVERRWWPWQQHPGLFSLHRNSVFFGSKPLKLMILGFILLIPVFSRPYIAQICVPPGVAGSMLPCHATDKQDSNPDDHHRRLLWYEHIALSAAGGRGTKPSCKEEMNSHLLPCQRHTGRINAIDPTTCLNVGDEELYGDASDMRRAIFNSCRFHSQDPTVHRGFR